MTTDYERRRPREEFRETPWHGRAASCIRCETFPGPAGRSQRQIEQEERTHWEHAQTRAKLRMYQRYAQTLRLERIPRKIMFGMGPIPSTWEEFSARMAPYYARREHYRRAWGPIVAEWVRAAHTKEEQ
ncbi:hypothetical protein ACFUGD_01310 [Streptomyces sp. NPDC057217]|uniref:hypothetical protein n=1 Tax=Streptomyces sp. NPDC057217 TaxID=3346054 RepID=UPI0036264C88